MKFVFLVNSSLIFLAYLLQIFLLFKSSLSIFVDRPHFGGFDNVPILPKINSLDIVQFYSALIYIVPSLKCSQPLQALITFFQSVLVNKSQEKIQKGYGWY